MSTDFTPQRLLRKILGMRASASGKVSSLASVALDTLPVPVAVVDRRGKIISINKCWADPAWGAGMLGGISIGLGSNYLEMCDQAAAAGFLKADDALKGIRGVCDGSIPSFELDYPSPVGARWFSMTVTPLLSREGGAVITQRDISDLKRTQASLRESEEKFQLIAGKVPVMIWMAGPDQRCIYFNDQWLDFTGRRLDQELKNGWVEGIHPDHRGLFQTVLREAFERKRNLRLNIACDAQMVSFAGC